MIFRENDLVTVAKGRWTGTPGVVTMANASEDWYAVRLSNRIVRNYRGHELRSRQPDADELQRRRKREWDFLMEGARKQATWDGVRIRVIGVPRPGGRWVYVMVHYSELES